jgi:hypothetical protein
MSLILDACCRQELDASHGACLQGGFARAARILQGCPWQARAVDARFAEYVPRDILAATDGLDLDLDLNELMVRGLRPYPYP